MIKQQRAQARLAHPFSLAIGRTARQKGVHCGFENGVGTVGLGFIDHDVASNAVNIPRLSSGRDNGSQKNYRNATACHMESLLNRIDARLQEIGMSREGAARLAGRSRDFIRNLEKNPDKPTIPRADHLFALARVLQCAPGYLLGESEDVGSPPSKRPVHTRLLEVRYRVEAGPWREVEDMTESYGQHEVPVSLRYASFPQWLEEVVGDCLDKLILPGRLVHVVDAIELGYSPADGDIVVVERRRAGLRERTLKQVEITGRRIMLWPRSNNPKWQEPLDVSLVLREASDDIEVEIVGLVVADFKAWK
jgi:transcriptional regulator with XRE-family HTH domain